MLRRAGGRTMDPIFRRPDSLLRTSPAFLALDEAARARLAADLLMVAESLTPRARPPRPGKGTRAALERRQVTRPELLPASVQGLISGTFAAVVDASLQQMHAYAALLAEAARSIVAMDPEPEARAQVALRLEAGLREIFGDRDPAAETP